MFSPLKKPPGGRLDWIAGRMICAAMGDLPVYVISMAALSPDHPFYPEVRYILT
jgi:hypothetical protein